MANLPEILFFGATGWMGGHLIKALEVKYPSCKIIPASARLDNYDDLRKCLEFYHNVDYIVLAAGLTGRPNIDWCENHKEEVLAVNVIGPSIVAKFAFDHHIHLTYLGTGCIYTYENEEQMNDPQFPGFTEEDTPNYDGSWYSFTKMQTEIIMNRYHALILRIRMPISDDLHHRSLLTKITGYQKVVNIPNSMTVVHDLVPVIPEMMDRHLTGIYNFTNPGVITHNELLDKYIQYIDPSFKYTNFTVEEQSQILKAPRSSVKLEVKKLLSEFPDIPDIKTSIDGVFKRMADNLSGEKEKSSL